MTIEEFAQEAFSDPRLAILREVDGRPSRYTDLARTLRISEGELSRHLKRLTAARLLAKGDDGRFETSALAKIVLAEAERIGFLAARADYFASHSVAGLPADLTARIPDLSRARFGADPYALFSGIQDVFATVRERFLGQWIIGAHALTAEQTALQKPLVENILRHQAKVRIVALEEELPLYEDLVPRIAKQAEVRAIAAAPTSIAVSDTHALVSFDHASGGIDAGTAFFGDDPAFVRWCVDVFTHFWGSAKRVDLPKGAVAVRE